MVTVRSGDGSPEVRVEVVFWCMLHQRVSPLQHRTAAAAPAAALGARKAKPTTATEQSRVFKRRKYSEIYFNRGGIYRSLQIKCNIVLRKK